MAKNRLKKGIFITFEGVEGCGKSTQARLLFKHLKKADYDCVITREPGGTKIGEMIRRILLNPKNASLNDTTELFLFEANRAQVVGEIIKPALKGGKIVICDRFFDATMAYQGYANRFDRGMIRQMNEFATGGLRPHLTIILDISTREGLRRATRLRGKDRMEEKSISFHKRVRAGYIDISRKEPRRVKLIQTKSKVEMTQQLIKREVLRVIERYKVSR